MTTITPPSRWTPLDVREIYRFRDLLTRLTVRDLKLRYKQTALGAVWVILQPLLAAGVLSFVFGKIANLSSDGVPYFVFTYVGMTCWTLFSQTLTKVSGSLVGNAHLVSKVYFPRLVLPLSTIGSTLVDFAVASTMGIAVIAISGVTPGWALLTLPLWIAVTLAMATGVGLVAAALMVHYRDVGQVLPVFVQLLLYGTPIAYALSQVPEGARWAVQANPLAGVITGFRWAAIDTVAPSVATAAWSAAFALLAFLAGAVVFTRMERRFADVI